MDQQSQYYNTTGMIKVVQHSKASCFLISHYHLLHYTRKERSAAFISLTGSIHDEAICIAAP